MTNSKKERHTYFRVVTPSTWADLNAVSFLDAQEKLNEWGNVDESSEYYEHWQQRRSQCKIVKVTEIIEEIKLPTESNSITN